MVSSPEDDGIVLEIGRSLVECARLEHTLKQIIARIEMDKGRSFHHTFLEIEKSGIGLRTYAEKLISLVEDPSTQSCLEQIAKLNDRRNDIAHGVLICQEGEYFLIRSKSNRKEKKLEHYIVAVSIDDLKDFYQQLDVARYNLLCCFHKQFGGSAGVTADVSLL